MKPRKTTYLVHRWLGLIVSLQLLAWSSGGLVFSVLHLDDVRGERDIGAPAFDALPPESIEHLFRTVADDVRIHTADAAEIGSVGLVNRGLGPRWEIRNTRGDLLFDEAAPLLSEQQAIDLALRDFAPEATVASARLIDDDPPVEYRNGALPAWQVHLDHPKNPHIYVDARTGQVTARRNDKWRTFDFFWMLHTMDYQSRDNFNHLLLTIFSILAMATAGTGIALWCWRAGTRLRKRAQPAGSVAAGSS